MKLQTSEILSKTIPPRDGKATNLLVLVHGRTGNLRLLEWYSKRFKIPDLAFLTIQAPFEDKRPGQTDEGFSWYLSERQGIDESRKKLVHMVEELERQGFPSKKIYFLGFSQGAAMSLDLALRGPFPLGGVLAISGFCVEVEKYPEMLGRYARSQRILITHGTRDEIVTLETAQASYQRLRELQIPFEFKIFDKPHSFQLNTEVPYLESTLKKWIETTL